MTSHVVRRPAPYEMNTDHVVAEGDMPRLSSYFIFPAILHIGLALLLYSFRPTLPTVHAVATALIGLYVLLDKTPARLAYVCAYIAGAEIIWRMTGARVFWEYGKYLTVALLVLGILRWRLRLYAPAVVYFVLLLPSVFLTISSFSLSLARDAISFNLSGPLALGVASVFFYNVKLKRAQAARLFLVGVWPIVSIATLVIRRVLTSGNILFTMNSNFDTSGGYGPNQVSAILGLGVLFCFMYFFVARPKGVSLIVILGVSVALIAQSALTFSRGGLLNLVVAVPCALFFFLGRRGVYRRQVFLFIVALAALSIWLAPKLNAFTGGKLFDRFQDLDTTGRAELFFADMKTWSQHPLLGVGIGASVLYHSLFMGAADAPHTEYSRILAEHGIPGLLSLLLLAAILIQGFKRSQGSLAKGVMIGLALWSLTEMTHAAMRVVAISYVFALSLAMQDLGDTEIDE